MRNLPCPPRDLDHEHLSIALEVKARAGRASGYPVSNEELDAVVALYDAYDAAKGAPDALLEGADLDAALRTAIHAAYDLTQREGRLSSLRAELMRGVEHCPVCGISPPDELDHHLPKATYKPLAIYSRNLVPLCHKCNQHKGRTAQQMPEQRFVHPYLEVLPDVRFLRVQVSLEDDGLVADFSIDPAAGLPELLRVRLDNQLQRLHLNDRYAREINAYLTNHTTALHMCFHSGGAESVRAFLNTQAEFELVRFHPNHWRPSLLLALAGSDAFCDGGFRRVLPSGQSSELAQLSGEPVPAE